MHAADAESQLVNSTLEEARRRFPPAPQVERYDWRFHVDSTGEDSVLVTVILKDPPGGGLYGWSELAPIRNAIVETFQQSAVRRWPYIQFSLESELKGPEEDEDSGHGADA
ncbi:hypothetical protein WMF31_01880 [Sorangium sp. So ce1036]|uniref:hypothetical protein n=1 Tax=Sorangium sp. So ce1036 TaxID=3133328 RepID=UPI003F12ABAC